MRNHRRGAIGAMLLAVAIVATACSSGGDTEGPEVIIGAQDFGESAILAEIYKGALESAGFSVRVQAVGGFRDLELGAFSSGDINMAPEYAASMLEFLTSFSGKATSDKVETTSFLNDALESLDLEALAPSDALDTNAFVMTAERSAELGITRLSDLADHEAGLVLGGPPDCETNPFCIPGLSNVYGVDLARTFQPLDAGLITVQALEADQIDIAVLFSTSGVIAAKNFVLLEDDRTMLAADNIVPVITTLLRQKYGAALTDLLDSVSAKLTTADLTAMNKRYDIDNEDADAIAADWLADNGF